MSRLEVVTFGEAMAMFVADEPVPLERADRYTRAVAGAELNVAVGLARLGHRVGWVSRLGDDPLGRYLLDSVRRAGVDAARVVVDRRHPTGFQLKGRVEGGDPEVVYFRRGSAASHLEVSATDDAYLGQARHLHLTGIPPALSAACRRFSYHAVERARAAGLTVSFDPNLRPSLWPDPREMRRVVNDLAGRCDWVLPGVAEGRALTGSADPRRIARFYLDRGVGLVAVKLGARGSQVFTGDDEHTQPGFPVRVVDTVGAGDGYAVGLISGMLDGLAPAARVERANAIGAMAVTSRGDQDGLPTRQALDAFLARHRESPIAPAEEARLAAEAG
jgi:sugar/nucleoside kinase (ribokinase family)